MSERADEIKANEQARIRRAWVERLDRLPDDATVRVSPLQGHRLMFNGRTYEHPRRFNCTMAEARRAPVSVWAVVKEGGEPETVSVAERVKRGKGLNRLQPDQAGFDRAE